MRFLIVLRPMTKVPHLRDRVQKCVKPRKSKVSGFPSASFPRCLAAWRPKRISRVLFAPAAHAGALFPGVMPLMVAILSAAILNHVSGSRSPK
jgi:hypothetical protein